MTKNTEERIPEESIDPKSKIAREANAFLNAIASGADEDEADEAAFLEVNPNGVVVDEEGDVLKKGKKSAIEVGTKVEIEEGEAEQPEEDSDEDYAESKKDCAEDSEATMDSLPRTEFGVENDSIVENEEKTAEEADSDDELAEDAEPADEALVTFEDLGLADEVLEAIKALNYETPSPIQAKAIPALLQGGNLLGTAQTGTGKTAAFSLPLLSRLDFNGHETSMLVLTPTRELAIQVSEAIQQYAAKMPKVHVVPVYGGQDIAVQLRALKRQANIVVATPGRLIDHIKRGSIVLSGVKAIVLDEADEMLDMGFMEDVETILKEIPASAQRALFSATMPKEVKKIIEQHLGEYEEACIEGKTTTVENIRQRYLLVKNEHKIEALARVLEGEDFDGVLIFVRTKQNTTEVAEKLESRGFNVAPLNGDLAQSMRERTINRLKMGKLDIVVATDVAARGIDVDRITHVVNYDIPYDTESYVHRIGRTGRAGRSGNAILFITPREKKMLKIIEKATRQPIETMELPTAEIISAKRVAAFKDKIKSVITTGELDKFKELVQSMVDESQNAECHPERSDSEVEGSSEVLTAIDIAAAVIKIWQKKQPLFPELKPLDVPRERGERRDRSNDNFGLDREEKSRLRKERNEGANGVEEGYLRYYLGVGRRDHVTPRDIVGAIAGEGNISSSNIGRIKLFDKFSTVELPETMPQEVLDILADMTIRGNESRFRLMTDEPPTGPAPGTRPRASREDRRSFHRDGDRHGKKFGDDKPFENRKARREKMFADRKPGKFEDRPFRKDHDERSFGDKPFRKTRRFGRV
ncbi:DEAD/DEAH box helicase [Fibrobacter sp. UWH4]|uniref:DEAD/DEAH box helicase n=1 Tax=Fibrobacter sp. UWH4 TaxID=1896210 RepID=UPI00091D9AA0|nr:DEAD/DEAH box helicase [Fibrobacter sp. UWH4]SHK26649.1 ATP-dependent RNA helicase CsdA [Fibrobacter sp. UWH4]